MEININVWSKDQEIAVENASKIRKELDFFVPEARIEQEERALQPDEASFAVLTSIVKVIAEGEIIIKVLNTIVKLGVDWFGEDKKNERIELKFKSANGSETMLVLENVQDFEKIYSLIEKIQEKSYGF